jgi:hypothetical protein
VRPVRLSSSNEDKACCGDYHGGEDGYDDYVVEEGRAVGRLCNA